jgi:hypothetical protein
MHIPSIPVDVLYHILEHVDKASLVNICLVNKVCCSCSRDILYRHIRIDGRHFSSTKLCQTLSRSTHLAKRVRSVETIDISYSRIEQELRKSLQNMTCLRSLSFLDTDPNFGILDGCTFKLDSFHSEEYYSHDELHRFLCSQPSLTNIKINPFKFFDVPKWGVECLPNLTRVTTYFTWLPYIIPNRPVNQVISYGYKWSNDYVDLSFFTLSNAPIQKLAIDYSYLYLAPLQLLASIFPALTHLTLRHTPTRRKVNEPFLFIYR